MELLQSCAPSASFPPSQSCGPSWHSFQGKILSSSLTNFHLPSLSQEATRELAQFALRCRRCRQSHQPWWQQCSVPCSSTKASSIILPHRLVRTSTCLSNHQNGRMESFYTKNDVSTHGYIFLSSAQLHQSLCTCS